MMGKRKVFNCIYCAFLMNGKRKVFNCIYYSARPVTAGIMPLHRKGIHA